MLVAACDLSTRTQVSADQIRLMDKVQTISAPARQVDMRLVQSVADEYHKGSTGGIDVVLGYVSRSAADESAARQSGDAYLNALRKAGITDPVRVSYVPVDQERLTNDAVISYRRTVAEAPANCTDIPGLNGSVKLAVASKYPMGCATKTMMGKMVSRPQDLKGVAGTGDDEARRQGAVVEKYKAGVKNEKLEGINASTVGSGG